jgi:glutamate synthase domain-containing protein 2
MRSGWDVLVAGLLGADEFGFSTAPLIGRQDSFQKIVSLKLQWREMVCFAHLILPMKMIQDLKLF